MGPCRWTTVIVSALALAVACRGEESTPEPSQLVFVLAGQSNMVGFGVTADLPDELRAVPSNLRYYLDGQSTTFAEQVSFGPEVAFAHRMSEAFPDREIVLIKHAIGGTSLLAWAPVWDSARAEITANAAVGPLYSHLMEYVADAPLESDAELGAVLWMQGERDARYPEAGRDYLPNLEVLVSRLRADLQAPDLPFILGLVNPPEDGWPATEIVREAQRQAEARIPRVGLVSTEGVTKGADNLHYDSEGQLELGRRFAQAYLTFVAGYEGGH